MYLNKNQTKKKKKTLRKQKTKKKILSLTTWHWTEPQVLKGLRNTKDKPKEGSGKQIFYGKNGLSVLGQRWQTQEG